jgi:nucleotide-binding universal stress UspA family protein
MNVDEILLATDFSDVADHATRVARGYAERLGARVHLFHVLSAGEYDVTRLLAHTRDKLGDRVPVIIASALGDPAEAIVRYAAANQVGLIVVGTHGRTGFSRALLGSVAERVVRTAPCPVLTVPPPAVAADVHGPSVVTSSSRCLVCARPSRDQICEPCRAKIRGEALERRRRGEHGGLV